MKEIDFATPVSSVDAVNQNGSVVITIQSGESYEYMAYQTDNKLTISLKRPEAKSPLRPKTVAYSGKKISLDFQDIEVRRVLQLLEFGRASCRERVYVFDVIRVIYEI